MLCEAGQMNIRALEEENFRTRFESIGAALTGGCADLKIEFAPARVADQ